MSVVWLSCKNIVFVFLITITTLTCINDALTLPRGAKLINVLTSIDKSRVRLLRVDAAPKKVEDNLYAVHPGCPLEIIHNKRLVFANFLRISTSNNLYCRLFEGNSYRDLSIDAGQVVSAWTAREKKNTYTDYEWNRWERQAISILKGMPRRFHLVEQFWKHVNTLGTVSFVNSSDLGMFLFHYREYMRQFNTLFADCSEHAPRSIERGNERNAMPVGRTVLDGPLAPLTPTQQCAAAMLLWKRDDLFKRNPCIFAGVANGDFVVLQGGSFQPRHSSERAQILGRKFVLLHRSQFKSGPESESTNPNLRLDGDELWKEDDNRFYMSTLIAIDLYSAMSSKTHPPPLVRVILKLLNMSSLPTSSIDCSPRNVCKESDPTHSPTHSKASDSVVWPPAVVDSVRDLVSVVNERRALITNIPFANPGDRLPIGKLDYRTSLFGHVPICVDGAGTSFFDDAFSVSDNGEIMVHIVDVVESMQRFPFLKALAEERAFSFFSTFPVRHMLPTDCLRALKLSTEHCNEVITVSFLPDKVTGRISKYSIFPAVIGPVHPISLNAANEALANLAPDSSTSTPPYDFPVHFSAGLNATQYGQDLFHVFQFCRANSNDSHWVKSHEGGKEIAVRQPFEFSPLQDTSANRMQDLLLTLYSHYANHYCHLHSTNAPLIWSDRHRNKLGIVRRFATRPLRLWLSYIQQNQLRAALQLSQPSKRSEIADAVKHYNRAQSEWATAAGIITKRNKMAEFLARYGGSRYRKSQAQLTSNPTFLVVGVGIGGKVRIPQFNLDAIANKSFDGGQVAFAKLRQVDDVTGKIYVDILN